VGGAGVVGAWVGGAVVGAWVDGAVVGGSVVGAGPDDTMIVTVSPLDRCVPPEGSVPITRPGSTESEYWESWVVL